jgi:putative aminophosphonate oxidoreductase
MNSRDGTRSLAYSPAIIAERSLWLQQALRGAEEDQPCLDGDWRVDVCVVGGGYTGLWTALRLKELEPSLDVAVLEADVCGGGASGRNGGFVLSWWVKFLTLEKVCGTEEALRLCRASASGVTEIGDFCRQHDIDAHYHLDGWLWTASNRQQLRAWEPTIRALEKRGESPFQELRPEVVANRSGTRRNLSGVFEPIAASVQPALLARGLRKVALERGVRIFEHSPVLGLQRSRPPRLRTPRGHVVAERVVLAMNAWLGQVEELRAAIAVIGSDMIATEPIPDRLREIGLTTAVVISDSRMLVNYYRTTADGRVAFGKPGRVTFRNWIGPSFQGRSHRTDEVAASFRWFYPMLDNVAIETSWTGPVDRSPSGLPFFVRVGGRPDIVCGAGYSGNGVGPSFLGGRILASLALGRDDEWSGAGVTRDPLGRFPQEPLRFVGGRIVRWAVARKESVEDADGKPGAFTTRVAALAPPGHGPEDSKKSRR